LIQTAWGADTSLLVEERVIKTGTYNGLSIGMTKLQAFSVASRLGAAVIAPSPCDPFVVSKDNAGDLPSLSTVEGVRLTDTNGSYVDIYIKGGQVSKIILSPTPSFPVPVSIGDKTTVAKEKLISALMARSSLSIHPIVGENTNALKLNSNTLADQAAAGQHNCWKFELTRVKPAGATYELVFADNGLSMIIYRRARVRVE
jgi:hypothetical protein